MDKDMRCAVFWLLIFFSVVIVRMDSQMGGSSGARGSAASP